jgi:hypothetical protein
MSKRLQVLLQDPEYREYKRLARSRHLTLAAWVRQALAAARQQQPGSDVEKKLAAIREAARYQGAPSPDIEQMLAEIEQGYLPGPGEPPIPLPK